MVKLKIYLFRHGKTFYNKRGIFTGWKDSKLAPEGIANAKKVARKLKNKKFQVAFHTSLSRSKDTLKEVLKFHPECRLLIEDDLMIERSYGDLEGSSHESFIKRIGKQEVDLRVQGDAIENLSKKDRKKIEKFLGQLEYEIIHRGYNNPPPNGESFAMVEKRVKKFVTELKKFMKRKQVNVAISAHGNSIRLFRKIMENASKEQAIKWVIPYDDYYEYEVN